MIQWKLLKTIRTIDFLYSVEKKRRYPTGNIKENK